MKISFTTLGCPDWSLDDICAKGGDYDGVDFRGLQETMDITQLPAFTSGVAETRRQLQDAGLEVSGLSSSIRVCVPDKLEENIEEARRSIAVAKDLGCGRIRVFGGPAAVLFGAMPTLSALTQIVFVGHVFPTPAAHCETVQVS